MQKHQHWLHSQSKTCYKIVQCLLFIKRYESESYLAFKIPRKQENPKIDKQVFNESSSEHYRWLNLKLNPKEEILICDRPQEPDKEAKRFQGWLRRTEIELDS